MLKDSLQKRLQQMEGENPSPSLETTIPTLKEKGYFLGRYLSGTVKQVPQKDSITKSLDDLLNEYKETIELAELPKRAKYWMKLALEYAREGQKSMYMIPISIAEGKREVLIPKKLKKLVHNMYLEAIPIEGPKRVEYWMELALEYAKDGKRKCIGFESAIRMAQDYAKECGIKILQEDIDKVSEVYEANKLNSVPIQIKYWQEAAKKLAAEGQPASAIVAKKIVRDYAREIGLQFDN